MVAAMAVATVVAMAAVVMYPCPRVISRRQYGRWWTSDYQMGNYPAAMQSSIDANKWGNWAITLLIIGGLLSITGWLLYYFLVFAAAMSGSY